MDNFLTSTDYWPEKIPNLINTDVNPKNSPDNIFSRREIEEDVISIAEQNGFLLTEPIDFTHGTKLFIGMLLALITLSYSLHWERISLYVKSPCYNYLALKQASRIIYRVCRRGIKCSIGPKEFLQMLARLLRFCPTKSRWKNNDRKQDTL